MSSFFDGLKKIAQGKPVYGPSEQPVDNGRPLKVFIERTETDIDGDDMRTYADIRNDSSESVFLDKIRLLGTTRELDTTLKAKDRKELLIYSGKAPEHSNDHDAELQYKTLDGTYYKARHDVRFKPQDDAYVIDKMPYENTSQI